MVAAAPSRSIAGMDTERPNPRPREPSGEQLLAALGLIVYLTALGIIGAALLPTTAGLIVAFGLLLATVGVVAVYITRFLGSGGA
jgi:hypothetical protein